MAAEMNGEKSSEKVTSEIWKPVKGYEGLYVISNLGRIKSFARPWDNRTLKDRIMRQYVGKTGYFNVRLCKNSRTKLCKTHRLVAEAFIDNPHHYPVINHKDGNKLNNNVSNLEWCTYSHNIKHAYDHGLRKIKRIAQVNGDGSLVREWRRVSEASRETGTNLSHIWDCCNNKRDSAGGYIWQYIE